LRIGNEFKIGLTVVVAVLIGFVGFRVMKDVPIFRQGTILFANYEKVDGLSVGTPILVSGIKIGSVQRLTLLPSDSVQVTLNINQIDGLPTGSVAYIRSVDILGSRAIEIERGSGSTFIPYGAQIAGVFDEGIMGELTSKSEGISTNISESTVKINELLGEFQSLLRDGGKDNISGTLSNLNDATAEIDALIKETNADVKASLQSMKNMLANLENLTSEERGELQSMIKSLDATTSELEVISRNLNATSQDLAQIMGKINNGEGTLGLLVNDSSMYHNIDSLTVNMNELIKNLNENPRHYLRHLRLVSLF
jgi:phospholipid/cholesterol/gamma-HCH transport system substrate-binding protein